MYYVEVMNNSTTTHHYVNIFNNKLKYYLQLIYDVNERKRFSPIMSVMHLMITMK